MAEMLPHVWDTRGGFLSFTSIADISTALMKPRRPKQYCLQLVTYIYIYIYICIYVYLFLNNQDSTRALIGREACLHESM